MSNEKLCLYCGASLTHKRRDARFCSPAHRAAKWRIEQDRAVSIKLTVPKCEFLKIKYEADMSGLLINQFIINKVASASGCAQ
ncbi:hypothetical protein [Pseudomonas helleri]|uniref:Uncharacterized protein n=1 Tax=Pseudomonas helleri TaxID=1608996 RepID=A0A6A7YT76_9PSED|nr:hypothetical protein [Pseudomonas helleri]MQT24751.1 hypothetical protein [Pseudomonas helleri]MQT78510.1 hypothetical protein [Pseudomonas helleri]MQU15584.1 hypothetical protein [Pseudomonas helleri]